MDNFVNNYRHKKMKNITMTALLCFGIQSNLFASDINQLFNIDLPPIVDNQEVVLITVEFQPGESDLPHTHNAQVLVYVLEGSIVMQVEGQEAKVLNPGDTFYENPDDVHMIGKNASTVEKAKFLAFFIKTKGEPILKKYPN
jgi:quercetin dioxygenase-like cupin family protein